MPEPARLHPADVEAIARRSAELVLAAVESTRTPRLVDAASVAALFGVDRGWVYEHAEQLGAVRLGDGARPRLRFELETARGAFVGPGATNGEPSETPEDARSPGRRRRAPASPGRSLLPIRGTAA
jgi:hypothetical protein